MRASAIGLLLAAAVLSAPAVASATVQDAPVTTSAPAPAADAKAAAKTDEAPKLNCATGPIQKTFGGQPWLVVGCDDGKTLTFVAAQGNPSAPFVILMSPKDDGYALTGDGEGDEAAAKAAFADIQALSAGEVGLLFEELRQAANKSDSPAKK
jgi:hypothetical protein